jgi:hypothetical protein
MIATLSLTVRILIHLDFTLPTLSRLWSCCSRSTSSGLRVENSHHITQAVAVDFQERVELLFELDFALKTGIVFRLFNSASRASRAAKLRSSSLNSASLYIETLPCAEY